MMGLLNQSTNEKFKDVFGEGSNNEVITIFEIEWKDSAVEKL